MSNFLITGAEGMIGSRLSKFLTDIGHSVTEFEGDVADWEVWSGIDTHYTYIIHLAALAGVRPSFDDPETYFHNNVTGTHNMFRFASRNAGGVLYASSSNAYEWWGNPYAATKKMNEVQAQCFSVPSIGMRFHTVWPGRDDMLFKKLQRGEVTYINKGHTRDFIHVEDLLKLIHLITLKFGKLVAEYPVLDLGNGYSVNVSDVAKTMGYEGQYISENPRGERVDTIANIQWAHDLGWYPTRDILNVEDHVDVT